MPAAISSTATSPGSAGGAIRHFKVEVEKKGKMRENMLSFLLFLFSFSDFSSLLFFGDRDSNEVLLECFLKVLESSKSRREREWQK